MFGTEIPAVEPVGTALQPAKLSAWQRWKLVLHELLGKGRGARQLAGIMVCPSSTLHCTQQDCYLPLSCSSVLGMLPKTCHAARQVS